MPDPGHLRHGRRVCSRPRAAPSTPSSSSPDQYTPSRERADACASAASAPPRLRSTRPSASRRPACTPSSAWAACSRRHAGAGARRAPAGELAEGAAGSSPSSRPRRSCAVAVRRAAAQVAARRRAARRGGAPLHAARAARAARSRRGRARSARRRTTSTARVLRAARDLVSRDTSQLDASEISGAAIQSLAENLSDSVVAPLLAYAAGGLPGRRGLPRAQHRRRDVGLSHARVAAPRPGRGARPTISPTSCPRALTALLIAARAPQRTRGAARSRCATTGSHPRPTAAGRWRRWPAAWACASSSATPTRSTPRRRRRHRPTSAARSESSVGKALMVQGCTSHAGKSYLTAALCRLLADEGLRVAPFKAQNMSNNAGVTDDGRELGRAQIVQAAAARIAPAGAHEPRADQAGGRHALPGRRAGRGRSRDLAAALARAPRARSGRSCASSLHSLLDDYDVVVIEGAGSPAEINLRDGDIVNMAVALEVAAPVLLCCDIDRGGAFAHLLGTWHCLAEAERDAARRLPAQPLPRRRVAAGAGPRLARGAHGRAHAGRRFPGSTSRCPRRTASRCRARPARGASRSSHCPGSRTSTSSRHSARMRAMCARPAEIEAAAAIVIPGTKSTLADLEWLRSTGIAGAIGRRAAAGVPVLGICGGLQILGPQRARSARCRGWR